jgi:hypothetical protein
LFSINKKGASLSIGNSGRIVIEIDPQLKRQLYSNLLAHGLSLKEWFILNANKYIEKTSNEKLMKHKKAINKE